MTLTVITNLKKHLLDSVDDLSIPEILKRIEEIDDYFSIGYDPPWSVVAAKSKLLSILYGSCALNEEFMLNYKKILSMKCLDKCKEFTILPKVTFVFSK